MAIASFSNLTSSRAKNEKSKIFDFVSAISAAVDGRSQAAVMTGSFDFI